MFLNFFVHEYTVLFKAYPPPPPPTKKITRSNVAENLFSSGCGSGSGLGTFLKVGSRSGQKSSGFSTLFVKHCYLKSIFFCFFPWYTSGIVGPAGLGCTIFSPLCAFPDFKCLLLISHNHENGWFSGRHDLILGHTLLTRQ
jgi:hypothetical protein